MAKNFLDKDGVSRLIYNFKSLFATLSHKHEISDLTDYTVDSALSSTSTNPIQNKVVNEGFSLVANSLTSMQNSIKGKADKEHEHTNYALISYVDETFAKKSDVQDVDLSNYETKEDASAKLDEAKQYTDTKTSGLASTSTVDTKISTHNTSTSAHSDIRDLITGLTNRLNALADSDDTTLDQMSEIVEYIKSNKSLIDSITTSKVSVSDIVDNLTTSNASKVLSAKQGIALKGLIDTLQTAVNGKAAQTSLDSHTGNTTAHITSTERTNWNAAKTHADSAHAPSNAQPNQNAFSNVKVGSTTIAADTTTDTLELVGSNVTITPDATNDKVTIAVADGSTSTKGIVKLENSTSSTSTTTAATPSSVKSAYDLANQAKTAADNAKSIADGKANASHTHTIANVTNLQSTLDEKASQTDFDALETKVYDTTEYLEELANGVKTVSGSNIVAQDSHAGGLKVLNLYGKSEQEKTSGKNLLKNVAKTSVQDGITYTVYDDGTVMASGTATATTALALAYDGVAGVREQLLGKEVILSGCPAGGSGSTYKLQCFNYSGEDIASMDFGSGTRFTFTNADKGFNVAIIVYKDMTVSNLVFKPMIRLASITDDTFEPYTNGPSPNPEYEQPIVSAGQMLVDGAVSDVGIQKKLIGKNQIDVNATMGGLLDHATGVFVSNGAWLTTEFIEVADNIVTMSVNNVSDNFIVRFCEYDSKKMFLRTVGNPVGVDGNASKTIELLSNTKYVRVSFGFNGRACTPESYIASGNVIQLEYSSEATEIEPYTEQNLTINRVLRGIPVTDASLANYTDENGQMWCADYGDVERKVWVQRIGKSVFNGNDVTWYINAAWETDNTMAFYTTPPNVYSNPAIAKYLDTTFCSHFIHKNVGFGSIDEECFRIANTIMYIRVQKDRLSSADVNGLKAYLSTISPIEVNYILATPIETPMTDEEIIALHSMKTSNGVTHITSDNVPDAPMLVKYGTSEVGALSLENGNLIDINSVLIDSKSDSNHTHNYAGSSSTGGAATSALKMQTYKQGSTTETYGTQYQLYAQWQSDGSTLQLVCDDYTVKTDAATNATKATQDASGNVITSTYATKSELNNKVNKSDFTVANGVLTLNFL